MSILKRLAIASTSIITSMTLMVAPAMAASAQSSNFETYTLGTVHNQDGWSSLGSAGFGCAIYDHAVAANTYGYAAFGTQSLRLSNAVTSGCFGDQTFSKALAEEAGETSAQGGGLSSGPRNAYFESQWDFASTVPGAEQPGLSVVASPDRGDGARMSWVQMIDTPTGLAVNFNDYQTGAFVQTQIASNLDRSVVHNIKITMQFIDGVQNDIVKVYVDGMLKHTGTSWEDYFREKESNPTRTVDSILFRTAGTAAPATNGKGFLIDNLQLSSGLVPVETAPNNKDQCKKDGWRTYGNFKNQGDCVSFVATKEKNKPALANF
ncbi:hypothetical protein H0X10_01895 [Candidatus Saccharibacteria bacterium]|nr:hypothetical protein [Candidatus Saccharibacteria bacterium]